MHSFTVVVAQSDCIIAEHLAANLHTHFKNIVVARDLDELRHHAKHEYADIVVVDLELAEPLDLRNLICDLAHAGVICTHRTPDEEMWRLCLEIGALDCCSCCDVTGIVRAARRHARTSATAA